MSKENISKETVKHIAKLANLSVAGEEEKIAELLSDTIDYIDLLQELDTEGVAETYQVTGLTNVYKKGTENKATLTKEESLSNAKNQENGLFVTKGVFDRE